MHLQLLDYLLSKLCNRQWLPKSHSYCRCRTDTSGHAEGSSTESSSVHVSIVVLQLFVDIVVTPMSLLGSDVCDTSLGVKPDESPPSNLTVRKSSCSPGIIQSFWVQTGCYLAPSDRSNLRFWASVTQPPPHTVSGLFVGALLDSCTTYWLLA